MSPKHPLAEVFGFPTDNFSEEANRHRRDRLCPFNNKSPNCTKDSIEHPIGVCSVFHGDDVVITCPVRFREEWRIASDAATFFFPENAHWTSLTEVRLKDKHGKSAGNIDIVLLSYDHVGRIIDYGALEVQSVYISGNIGVPFRHYMEAPEKRFDMNWLGHRNYPRPDYLSSSRKRLAPQLIYKGGILNAWKRKMAVAINSGFFQTLPPLEEVPAQQAEMAWFVYEPSFNPDLKKYSLRKDRVVYTMFEPSLHKITRSEAGNEEDFLTKLQAKLNRKLDNGSRSGFAADAHDE